MRSVLCPADDSTRRRGRIARRDWLEVGDRQPLGHSAEAARPRPSGRSDALVIDASGPWERVIEHPTLKHERPITGITRMSALIGKRKTQVAQLPNDWRVKSARRPLRAVTTG